MRFLLAALIALLSCNAVFAAEEPARPAAVAPVVSELTEQVEYYRDRFRLMQQENARLKRAIEGREEPLWTDYIKAKQREYKFQQEMMDVTVRSFWHQTYASYAIGTTVLIIVLAGVYFAYIQLQAGLTPQTASQSAGATGTAAPPKPPDNELKASLKDINISTSIVGLIVLVISFAFLYLYTQEIYAIRYIPLKTIGENPAATNAGGTAAAPTTAPLPANPATGR